MNRSIVVRHLSSGGSLIAAYLSQYLQKPNGSVQIAFPELITVQAGEIIELSSETIGPGPGDAEDAQEKDKEES